MLDSWNSSIFFNIKQRLQDSAMKLVHAERNGEAFDSQLVIGVRESYGKLSLYGQKSSENSLTKTCIYSCTLYVVFYAMPQFYQNNLIHLI